VPDSYPPPSTNAPVPSNTANFVRNDSIANGYNDGFAVTGSPTYASQNYLTDVGAYRSANSPYGTNDQGGNVTELVDVSTGIKRTRGGGFGSTNVRLQAIGGVDLNLPFAETGGIGFRVALVPEPSSFILAALGIVGLAVYGWRKQSAT
jgi:hypothetical protein